VPLPTAPLAGTEGVVTEGVVTLGVCAGGVLAGGVTGVGGTVTGGTVTGGTVTGGTVTDGTPGVPESGGCCALAGSAKIKVEAAATPSHQRRDIVSPFVHERHFPGMPGANGGAGKRAHGRARLVR
jgi:hypothetical protein